jgi:hypothetical protein
MKEVSEVDCTYFASTRKLLEAVLTYSGNYISIHFVFTLLQNSLRNRKDFVQRIIQRITKRVKAL